MLTLQRAFVALGSLCAVVAAAGLVQADIVRSDNLAGWWKLGEAATWNGSSWTVPDASANSNTATSANMEQADRVEGYPFDPYPETSYAMQFDAGSLEYLSTAYDPSLVMGSSYSMTAWVRQSDAISGDRTIAARIDGNQLRHNYFFQLYNRSVSFGFHNSSGGGWPKVQGPTKLNQNQWYHVAGVFDDDADTLTVYVNGRQDRQMSVFGSPSTTSIFGVSIGANAPEGNRYFDGGLDDVRIYNVAISPTDVASIYNNTKGDFPAIPEPSTFVLAVLGLLGCGWYHHRRCRA